MNDVPSCLEEMFCLFLPSFALPDWLPCCCCEVNLGKCSCIVYHEAATRRVTGHLTQLLKIHLTKMASEAIPQKELWPHSNVCGLKNGQYADSRLLPNISGGGSTINVLKEDPPSLSRSYTSIVNGVNISNVPNVPF